MKERPILFSSAMVRAILLGSKTQTRRVVKPQPVYRDVQGLFASWVFKGGLLYPNAKTDVLAMCPYGQPGDRLWVREAHSIGPGPNAVLEPVESGGVLRWPHITYAADGAVERKDERWKGIFGKSRPSIHMHRWASRITLEVTGVRVERLQDLSEADARYEGIQQCEGGSMDYLANDYAQGYSSVASFRSLWESLNGASSWDANPWVWVVEFKRVEGWE